MGRVLGQPSGLAGGRVGPGGRDIWDWVNQYWADLTKNALVYEKHLFWTVWAISRPLVDTILCRISSRIHFWDLEGLEMAKIGQKQIFS